MDLFGFKRRKAERQRNARIRAEALDNAIRTVHRRPSVAEDEAAARGAAFEQHIRTGDAHQDAFERRLPPRRRPGRAESDRSDTGLYGGGLYPHSSGYGMATDMNHASCASDPSPSRNESSSHDSLGAAGSAAFGDSGSGGYSSPSSYDSGSSSSSDSGSSGW